ncbi:hypothetical protein AVEN_140203-1, partial [Araneus ventricosus]
VEYDIESIVIKLCLPDVSRKKTDEKEEFGEGILGEIDPGILLMNIEAINVQLENELSKVFYPSTVEEFLAVNINPFLEKLRKLVRDADLQIIFHSAPEEMQSNSS